MGNWGVGARSFAEYVRLEQEVGFKRETYTENENFKVYLEEINNQVFVHVGIHNFSKAILKQIKEVWAEIMVKMFFLGYEEAFAYTKDNRIIKLIGGAKKVGQHQNYEVWKWELT